MPCKRVICAFAILFAVPSCRRCLLFLMAALFFLTFEFRACFSLRSYGRWVSHNQLRFLHGLELDFPSISNYSLSLEMSHHQSLILTNSVSLNDRRVHSMKVQEIWADACDPFAASLISKNAFTPYFMLWKDFLVLILMCWHDLSPQNNKMPPNTYFKILLVKSTIWIFYFL